MLCLMYPKSISIQYGKQLESVATKIMSADLDYGNWSWTRPTPVTYNRAQDFFHILECNLALWYCFSLSGSAILKIIINVKHYFSTLLLKEYLSVSTKAAWFSKYATSLSSSIISSYSRSDIYLLSAINRVVYPEILLWEL